MRIKMSSRSESARELRSSRRHNPRLSKKLIKITKKWTNRKAKTKFPTSK